MASLEFLQQTGFPLVVGSLVAGQAGVPMPSATLLMAASAFAKELHVSHVGLFLLVTAAIVLTDHLWFLIGKAKGSELLEWIENFSSATASAVGAVRRLNRRHGILLLLVAKFLPGVNALVIPASAAMHLSYWRFLVFNTLGTVVWAGTFVMVGAALGPVFKDFIQLAGPIVQGAVVVAVAVAVVWGLFNFGVKRSKTDAHAEIDLHPADQCAVAA